MYSHRKILANMSAILGLVLSFAGAANAKGPYLVRDINPTPGASSLPIYLEACQNKVFFNADDGVHGQELWASDGTYAGTNMVIDLVPGPDGSVPQWMTCVNDLVYFQADNNGDGLDFYVTNGTSEGTIRLADVKEDGDPFPPGCWFGGFATSGTETLAYFWGEHTATGTELWRSDGTVPGTFVTSELAPSNHPNSAINVMQGVGPLLYFSAVGNIDPIPGFDLWRSNGTLSGTYKLKELRSVLRLTGVGDLVYFSGEDDSGAGQELWVSDGTVAGTRMVKDIHPTGHGEPRHLTNVNGRLFFTVFEPTVRRELWVSDGTDDGTRLVAEINTTGGANIRYPAPMGDSLVFLANDGVHGDELWISDGTEEGTRLIADIVPGPGSLDIFEVQPANGKVYFVGTTSSSDADLQRLWVTDGTAEGTYRVAERLHTWDPIITWELTPVGDLLFFSGGLFTGTELCAFRTQETTIPAISTWGVLVMGLAVMTFGTVVIKRHGGSMGTQVAR